MDANAALKPKSTGSRERWIRLEKHGGRRAHQRANKTASPKSVLICLKSPNQEEKARIAVSMHHHLPDTAKPIQIPQQEWRRSMTVDDKSGRRDLHRRCCKRSTRYVWLHQKCLLCEDAFLTSLRTRCYHYSLIFIAQAQSGRDDVRQRRHGRRRLDRRANGQASARGDHDCGTDEKCEIARGLARIWRSTTPRKRRRNAHESVRAERSERLLGNAREPDFEEAVAILAQRGRMVLMAGPRPAPCFRRARSTSKAARCTAL